MMTFDSARLGPTSTGQDHGVIQPRIELSLTPVNSSVRWMLAPEMMQPPETRGDGHAAPPDLVMHELRRRGHLAIGPDRPFLVIEVEVGHHIREIDIGLEIRIDGADIAPIGGASAEERTQERLK